MHWSFNTFTHGQIARVANVFRFTGSQVDRRWTNCYIQIYRVYFRHSRTTSPQFPWQECPMTTRQRRDVFSTAPSSSRIEIRHSRGVLGHCRLWMEIFTYVRTRFRRGASSVSIAFSPLFLSLSLSILPSPCTDRCPINVRSACSPRICPISPESLSRVPPDLLMPCPLERRTVFQDLEYRNRSSAPLLAIRSLSAIYRKCSRSYFARWSCYVAGTLENSINELITS